ncbi:YolD-like protein [Halanaerobium saccharolyticum]|uniref:YolD-like protein n=1 Tax=Halanaerobium saccharolyticum TaxID=43595 RepID=A0A4R7Z623_9FIRM|nr:YolD-like family protein [Halanaerobium saccharolyticum]RAK04203.1 YolD-like protein [Halanaerobium saccharolyticum]TDW06774.1 YolD-like protein [Halanaerobium saccharolyticum]TDX62409.1 YolD-like protein [Halanaerobium saccharolyticum]
MNFKDRGNKKWNSLMLVEHQKKLKELKMREMDVKKPELDEQQLQEINFKINKALNRNLIVKIKFYKNKELKNIEGKILRVEKYEQQIKIKQLNKEIKTLKFAQILEISL